MFDRLLTPDQAAVLDGVRDYLGREGPLRRPRARQADALDAAPALAGLVKLGWLGVGLAEELGGAGLGVVEELIVQRECGRELIGPGALALALGAHAAADAGDAALARSILAGTTRVAFALPPAGAQAPAYAIDWTPGDLLLVCDAEGVGLFDAEAFADPQPEPCLDDSVGLHAGRLALHRRRHWREADAPLAQRVALMLAGALVGLAERAGEMAVEYAKVREQFGRPIGAFQAVKHRCADMGVRSRLAWSQAAVAALKLQGQDGAALDVAAAKLVAARAAHENARAAVQVHGAIGFQAECDVHWFVKRAHVYDQIGGAARDQARRLATLPASLW
jgi:alkylation response protein AidB-like acyl-CoA dehydrogenase